MERIKMKGEYIKLGQALKLSGLVDTGGAAKVVVVDGKVRVNGEIETRRGRKLYSGDVFSLNGVEVLVEA